MQKLGAMGHRALLEYNPVVIFLLVLIRWQGISVKNKIKHLGKVHLIWQGGGGDEEIETQSLKF